MFTVIWKPNILPFYIIFLHKMFLFINCKHVRLSRASFDSFGWLRADRRCADSERILVVKSNLCVGLRVCVCVCSSRLDSHCWTKLFKCCTRLLPGMVTSIGCYDTDD